MQSCWTRILKHPMDPPKKARGSNCGLFALGLKGFARGLSRAMQSLPPEGPGGQKHLVFQKTVDVRETQQALKTRPAASGSGSR
jgi:hypothetical protein